MREIKKYTKMHTKEDIKEYMGWFLSGSAFVIALVGLLVGLSK